MDAETWMNAYKAVELGFADEIMYVDNNTSDETVTFAFSRRAVTNALLDKMVIKKATKTNKNQPSIETLKERLKLI